MPGDQPHYRRQDNASLLKNTCLLAGNKTPCFRQGEGRYPRPNPLILVDHTHYALRNLVFLLIFSFFLKLFYSSVVVYMEGVLEFKSLIVQ